jgi:hypothetical protein
MAFAIGGKKSKRSSSKVKSAGKSRRGGSRVGGKAKKSKKSKTAKKAKKSKKSRKH